MNSASAIAVVLILLCAAQAMGTQTALLAAIPVVDQRSPLSTPTGQGWPCCSCPCCGLLLILFVFMMFFGGRRRGPSWTWLLLLPLLFRLFGGRGHWHNYSGGPFGGAAGGFGGGLGSSGAGGKW